MITNTYYVYILSHPANNVLYVGVTNDIVRRIFEHKKKLVPGFTAKFNVTKLVYYECFDFVDMAIEREKQIKGYSKLKKAGLINAVNPNWDELYNNGVIAPLNKTS